MLSQKFEISSSFKEQALTWAAEQDYCCFLNFSNLKTEYCSYSPFPSVLAVGAIEKLQMDFGSGFDALKEFIETHKTLLFGYFGYDLKNEIEELTSQNIDILSFPDIFFFIPQHLIYFNDNAVEIISENPLKVYEIIISKPLINSPIIKIKIQQRETKDEYIRTVESIKKDLEDGEVYELNYCIDFFAERCIIDPVTTFIRLSEAFPMPFSVFFKAIDKYILSASPERFLCKIGDKLVSQPMKGTARRSVDPKEDLELKEKLRESEKERSENMMIVDLVRNDLARSSVPGSITVEELFGVYSLSNVHQMISTVSSRIKSEFHFVDAIRNAFPMGSMTGAPKIRAMQLIEQYEKSRRGTFSGAFGYITPEGNYDFNVLIRTLLYDSSSGNISFKAGSAITYECNAEKEYQECLLKADTIRKILEGRN